MTRMFAVAALAAITMLGATFVAGVHAQAAEPVLAYTAALAG